ncbi:small integral membrane protein 1 isoform X1 [Symphalangus syndactylus]|uniref:small integral membrane protein 1 isoform X1 n=1 Tax=Symphalangus syndactylus TaxID=9590 RepID=UPI0030072238
MVRVGGGLCSHPPAPGRKALRTRTVVPDASPAPRRLWEPERIRKRLSLSPFSAPHPHLLPFPRRALSVCHVRAPRPSSPGGGRSPRPGPRYPGLRLRRAQSLSQSRRRCSRVPAELGGSWRRKGSSRGEGDQTPPRCWLQPFPAWPRPRPRPLRRPGPCGAQRRGDTGSRRLPHLSPRPAPLGAAGGWPGPDRNLAQRPQPSGKILR